MRHVVLFGKEPRSAQDEDRQSMKFVEQAAQMFGGKFRDAIDIARQQGRHRLGDPGGLPRATGKSFADVARDHQRRRRGEDEAVHFRARSDRLFEQIERALNIDGDEFRSLESLYVRFVKRAACTIALTWKSRIVEPTSLRSATEPTTCVVGEGVGSIPTT